MNTVVPLWRAVIGGVSISKLGVVRIMRPGGKANASAGTLGQILRLGG